MERITEEILQRVTAVARGESPADLLLTGGSIVNVFTREVIEGNLAIQDGIIAGVGPGYKKGETIIDVSEKVLLPGLIDAHLHIESTLLLPVELVRVALAHGTTGVIADPHEIANVLGEAGVNFMLTAGEGLPFDFFFTVPSCVPATHMESSGGEITAPRVAELLKHQRVVGLAEMMNYPGVVHADPAVLQKIAAAHRAGKEIDGHAPGLSGAELQAYLSCGITTDHECFSKEEALEKVGMGMRVILRQGSAARNLPDLLPAVTPVTAPYFMLGSDDKEADALIRHGHMNHILRQAVALGCDPLIALQMATLNPALHYKLPYRGALAPGCLADVTIVNNLTDFKVALVIKDGRVVAQDGRLTVDLPEVELGEEVLSTVKLARPLTAADFKLPCPKGPLPVIGVIPGQIVTEKLSLDPSRDEGGFVTADPHRDLLKLTVVERHKATGNIGLALVKGLGLREGAIASSVSHDSHNIIAAGANDEAIAAAVNKLAEIGGGFVVIDGRGKTAALLPLPVAGLMSTEKAGTVAAGVEKVTATARALGARPTQPFLTLSFLALPVIPHLKLTDLGLVDVDAFLLLKQN